MVINYRQLTAQHKQQIIDAFSLGIECRNIPAYIGVSDRAVARVLAEADINTKRRNRYTLNESYFELIDSPTKAYLLSLMAADGCVTATNYVVFESIDQELVLLLKSQLDYSGKIRVLYPKGDYAPHYRINFSSQQLARSLVNKGVFAGRGNSDICYFPGSQYLAAYTLGYFDGDGCAYVSKGRSGGKVCIVGSLAVVTGFRDRLGMGMITQHIKRKVYYWNIYGRNDISRFYKLLYQYEGLGLARKKSKIEQILGSYKRG
jgi:hypothetical protein